MSAEATFIDLVRRACDRDEGAAAELVRRFEPELRRVIRFQLTDPGLRRLLDSLDVCQSVLAAFFAQLHGGELRLTQPRQAAGLLALMARHKVIDWARQQRAVRRGGGAEAASVLIPGEQAPDPAPGPDDIVAGRDLLGAVRDRLAAPERELLDGWLSGQGWAEIAGERGGSPEALRKRLSRSIDEVAARLGLLEGLT